MMKKSVLIFVILSVIASALNYFLYPLLSRILAPSEYIEVTVALSLFTQISAFLSSIIAITIGLSKNEDTSLAKKKIEALQSFILRLFGAVAIFFVLMSPLIMSAIDMPILFALPIVLMMLFTIPIQIISGYLNGKNRLAKLGAIIVFCALIQFTVGIGVGALSQSGLVVLLAMSVSQLFSIVVIYKSLPKDGLPNIINSLKTPLSSLKSLDMKNILIYTTLASLAIMAINIVQVTDLLVFQGLESARAKFYADIYVISRVIFFAGMIFIWPFLGEINISTLGLNRKPFAKLLTYFAGMTIVAILSLLFFGDIISHLLFNSHYTLDEVGRIGVLSVLYKLSLLIITATVLYFVVIRKYIGIILALLTTTSIFIYTQIISDKPDIYATLIWLNVIAAFFSLIGIALVFFYRTSKKQ